MPQGAVSFLNESDRLAKLKMDSDIRFVAGNMMQFRNLKVIYLWAGEVGF